MTSADPILESRERMDASTMRGLLVESEHRGRYWWASQVANGQDVVDAGCGTGYGTMILAAAGARRVVGVDIADEALAVARGDSGDAAAVEFVAGDLHALPFPDASFDLVVSFETIEH